MASTCDIYKGSQKIGSGSITDGSKTIASYVSANGNHVPPAAGRKLIIVCTQAGTFLGQSYSTRVDAGIDESSSLTVRHACPFIGA